MYFALVSTPPPNDPPATSDCDMATPSIIQVQNDNGAGRVTSIPLSADSTGQDVLDCVRDPGYTMVHLVACWQHQELLVLPTDDIGTLLRELAEAGGSGQVQFIVRYEHTDTADGCLLDTEGRRSRQRRPNTPTCDTMPPPQWLPNLPGGGNDLTLSDLQALAARQQVAMETQQQALVARETRLKYLQQQEARHQQLSSEEARLQRMKDRVEAQELKLKNLRALKGQVEQYRTHNGHLNSELEAVRALFSEKEKELAVAVSRVDTLMKQLQELREVKAKEAITHGSLSNTKALNLELEKLRQKLLQQNQINAQHTSRLAAQQQLLQQRKDQVANVDARIEELQQRLKKHRSRQPPPPPPLQQPQPNMGDRSGERSSWGPQVGHGRKVGQNVAAVEPYIQYPPKDMDKGQSKEDLQAKEGVLKLGAKSQVSSGVTGLPSEENTSMQQGPSLPGSEEISNKKKSGEGRGDAPEEYKMPSIISSHFDAHRGRSRSAGKGRATGQTVGAGVVQTSVAAASKPVSQTSRSQAPSSTSSSERFPHSGTSAPQPVLNSFGKPGSLPKWPPPAFHDELDSDPTPPSSHPPPQHPHINICDEERQAGSGQSSPASSEGSGPLVKQGSGVFTNHPTATPSVSQPASNVTSTVGQISGQDKRKDGTVSAKLIESRGQQSGRQAPKPPPRMPQTVLQSRPSASPLSTAGSSLSPQSVVNSQSEGKGQDRSRTTSRKQEDPQNSDTSSAGSASPPEQGDDGKIATTIHLNQQPAPTYRYASRNLITNTYTGRLGSSALQRYQQLNKQLYSSSMGPQGTSSKDPSSEGISNSQDSVAKGSDSHATAGDQQSSVKETSMIVMVGEGPDGLTHFGLVGSPSYPDIASDKGSFKPNTPKHIRRRHSDSDNEELAKVLRRGDRLDLEQMSEDGANGGSNELQPDPSMGFMESSGNRDNADSAPCSPTKSNPEEGAQRMLPIILRQKKTILKGDNQRKSLNRVSFDPLALLLDASLEGELELVMRTAREVDNVSTPNDEGITSLHNAICAGHYHIIKFLIEFGADVNSPDSDGWTPLHCAASCNNLPMVRFLVEHGACLFATTISDHETAADKCEEDEDGYDHCSDYLYGVQEKLGIASNGTVYAVFDYSANKQDELSFKINDKLTVMRRGDDTEKEWWWAIGPGGREGYIPRNLLGEDIYIIASIFKRTSTL